MHPLAEYIQRLLDEQNLSMRAGSLKAGFGEEAISQIMRRFPGSVPRPATLRTLADTLGGDFYTMLRLAGYEVPEVPSTQIPHMSELIDLLSALPPERQETVMRAFLTLVQVQDALENKTPILPERAPSNASHSGGNH